MEIIIGIVAILMFLYFLRIRSQSKVENDLDVLVKGAIVYPDRFIELVSSVYGEITIEEFRNYGYIDPSSCVLMIRGTLFEYLLSRGHQRGNLLNDFVSAGHLDRATNRIYNTLI